MIKKFNENWDNTNETLHHGGWSNVELDELKEYIENSLRAGTSPAEIAEGADAYAFGMENVIEIIKLFYLKNDIII